MKNVLAVLPEYLYDLRGGDGKLFAECMKSLLIAETLSAGLGIADLDLSLRTTIGDGGVDARIRSAAPGAACGWLEVPTVWQFKGTKFASVTDAVLQKEVAKSFAQERIKAGDGYRFCVCDDPPPDWITNAENVLNTCIQGLCPGAPAARVITAAHIAPRLEAFGGLRIRYAKQNLPELLSLDVLARSVEKAAATYVPVPARANIESRLRVHLDFSTPPKRAVELLLGGAGVGKTRLAFEIAKTIAAASSLVTYTMDEHVAMKAAVAFASYDRMRAVLIADECGLEAQQRINETLKGCTDRVRVIAIYNEKHREQAPWLSAVPAAEVLAILEANFPSVAKDRREQYARLARGFLRIAIDLCEHDAEIGAAGDYGPVLESIASYATHRLRTEKDREVVQALALVSRVGCKDDAGPELDQLCAFCGLSVHDVRATAMRLRDAPGFVTLAGRYFYITPEPVARVMFEAAYQRWIALDPKARLAQFPEVLVDRFRSRVQDFGSEEVRRVVGETFRNEVISLTGEDLGNGPRLRKVASLVETDPQTFLPVLRSAVENATASQLLANDDRYDSSGSHGWGPRRTLVWLAEKAAQYPNYFLDAEAILWRLATHETEPGIANNASGVWQQLFQIRISGTATPFTERLGLLKFRSLAPKEEHLTLVSGAFGRIFSRGLSRVKTSAFLGGQLSPPEWQPLTADEEYRCLALGLGAIRDLLKDKRDAARQHLVRPVLSNLAQLVGRGLRDEVKGTIEAAYLDAQARAKLRDRLLELPRRLQQTTIKTWVMDWAGQLAPTDIHGRIAAAVALDPWRFFGKDKATERSQHQEELRSLAAMLVADAALFRTQLPILTSSSSPSAGILAEVLGEVDTEAKLLPDLAQDALVRKSASLLRPYVAGLVRAHPAMAPTVAALVDGLELTVPALALEVSMAAGILLSPVSRALRLYEQGRITAAHLRSLAHGVGGEPLTASDFRSLLLAVTRGCTSPISEENVHTGIVMLWARTGGDRLRTDLAVDRALLSATECILEAACSQGTIDYEWCQIIRQLAPVDHAQAARIAARGLVAQPSFQPEEVEDLLLELARTEIRDVLGAIQTVMLDPEKGVTFYFRNFKRLFAGLPPEALKDWLDETGIEVARRIARHLPEPYIDPHGAPIVPDLTAYVLTRFETDDRTFREFAAGVRSLKLYSGDIAAEHEKEAAEAQKFLQHPLGRIRQWAAYARQTALAEAAAERQRVDEEEDS